MTSNELAGAENGNFLVRERVRRVLDLLAPAECTYYPTCFEGSTDKTPWLLAVPKYKVVTAKVDPSIPRCETCGEPRSAHPGSQWSESLFGTQSPGAGWTADSDHQVLKSANWCSSELGWDQWISRDLFMSVRLLHLLKKVKAKGFHEATCQKPVKPDIEEASWITEKLQFLQANGNPLNATGTLSEEDAKWFRSYVKNHARDVQTEWDIKAVERRVSAKLPKSYIDFLLNIGPVSFENVDEQEGFTASILPPDELAIEEGYGDGFEDEESKAVKGLTFATTEHGDRFCFDVQGGRKEFLVVLYKHEGNFFEPYAENFVACIKRFAGGC